MDKHNRPWSLALQSRHRFQSRSLKYLNETAGYSMFTPDLATHPRWLDDSFDSDFDDDDGFSWSDHDPHGHSNRFSRTTPHPRHHHDRRVVSLGAYTPDSWPGVLSGSTRHASVSSERCMSESRLADDFMDRFLSRSCIYLIRRQTVASFCKLRRRLATCDSIWLQDFLGRRC